MRIKQYEEFQSQKEEDRRGVFTQTARRLGITEFLAEKDFWVCRTLDILMKEPPWAPKRFFKGGTSLSKGYGYIDRFSEDIDIVFNRHALECENGYKFKGDLDPANAAAQFLGADGKPSNKKREARFDELQAACGKHISGAIKEKLEKHLPECRVVPSQAEPQTLYVRYPSLFVQVDFDAEQDEDQGYFLPRVKVEGGARSAQAPAAEKAVAPYIQRELAGRLDLGFSTVTMISPERTFLEKIANIHGYNCRYRDQKLLPVDRDRMSRHYYDVAKMSQVAAGKRAMKNKALLDDVREHDKLAFRSAWRKHDELVYGKLQVIPGAEMVEVLKRDYGKMQDMMFGERPTMDWILARMKEINVAMNPK